MSRAVRGSHGCDSAAAMSRAVRVRINVRIPAESPLIT